MTDSRKRIIADTPATTWKVSPAYAGGDIELLFTKDELLAGIGAISNETRIEDYKVLASPHLNVRLGPGLKYPVVGTAQNGTYIKCYPDAKITADGYIWMQTVDQNWIASSVAASGVIYAAHVHQPDVPPTEQPLATGLKFGLHVYPYGRFDLTKCVEIAKLGLLKMVTVVNKLDVAHKFLSTGKVPYVVFRPNVPADDNYPGATRQDAIAWMEQCYPMFKNADKQIIISLSNWDVQEDKDDTAFWLAIMDMLDSLGYRGVVFNDQVGTPHMYQVGNKWISPKWTQRAPVLRRCLYYADGSPKPEDKQSFVGYHSYSAPGPYLASDIHDRIFYGERFAALYSVVPEYQPPLLLTEHGSFDADYQAMGGLFALLRDIRGSEEYLSKYPYVKAYAYWTAGEWNKSGFDADLTSIQAFLQAQAV